MAWQFDPNGGLTRQEGLTAPTYNDPFTSFLGQKIVTGAIDPALAMTMNAGNQGGMSSGLQAFLGSGHMGNSFQAVNDDITGQAKYTDEELGGLAKGLGIDVGGRTGTDLQSYLDSQTQDYTRINGLSAGWNPNGDPRGANSTLYRSENGKLVPYQTSAYSAPTQGSWLQENPGILAPLAVVSGGLAYGALAGAGAGAAGGAAAGEAGAGAAGAGAAGTAGGSSLGSLASGLQGWYAGLPGWGQGALTGAAQGGISSGLQGKNILQGALMGGLTGGVGAVGGQYLSSLTGLPGWASRAAVSSGLGGLTGGWRGALGGGLGSLAGSGLGEAGLPSQIAGRLGGLAGNFGAGALLGAPNQGGGAISGGAGGGSGGVGMGGGSGSALATAGGAARGGLSGGWRMPSATDAANASYLQKSYAPIVADTQRKKLADELAQV